MYVLFGDCFGGRLQMDTLTFGATQSDLKTSEANEGQATVRDPYEVRKKDYPTI
jgi:hypothetical protein